MYECKSYAINLQTGRYTAGFKRFIFKRTFKLYAVHIFGIEHTTTNKSDEKISP